MPRHSRLPPPPILAALLAAALLVSAARPSVSSKTPHLSGCCAVKTAHWFQQRWHVTLQRPGFVWISHQSNSRPNILSRHMRVCCAVGFCSPAAVLCAPAARAINAIRTVQSPEDPTDALWLRAYNGGDQLIVLARAGLLALVVLVAAVLTEGALTRPRRAGFAHVPLGVLCLLALSALLQLVLLPRKWQPAAVGGGALQSMLYITLVVVGAAVLPASALTLQALAVTCVYFILLVIQVVFWSIIGACQMLVGLASFYSRNLWLQIRLLYGNDDVRYNVDFAQDVYLEQLNISHDFVTNVSHNHLLRRVPAIVNHTAKLVLRSTLSPGNSARDFAGMSSNDHSETEDDETEPVSFDEFQQGLHLASVFGAQAAEPRPRSSPTEQTPLLAERTNDEHEGSTRV